MKRILYIFSATLAALVCGCEKDEPIVRETPVPVQHNVVNITVNAGKSIIGGDESKVTYDGNTSFDFESDDCLQLTLAKIADGVFSRKNVILPQKEGQPGTFSGKADLGSFSAADIHSAYIVKTEESRYNALTNSGLTGTALRFSVPVAQYQYQPQAGVFDGAPRVPFWSIITSEKIHVNGAEVTIDELTLTMTAAIFEFHVYGTDFTDEKIRSIKLTTDGTGTHFLAGDARKSTTGGQVQYARDGWDAIVSLLAPGDVKATAAEAPAVYMAVYPQSSATVLTGITVKTDKATYTKTLNVNQARATNKVYPININLATYTRSAYADNVEYSIDDGATWISSLPTDVTNATKLLVRGHNLTASDLQNVRSFLDAQAATVDVDMSDATYESNIFPAVFGNATAANACSKINTFLLPENITELASTCFRGSSITSVNMPGVLTVGDHAFRGCSKITSVLLPHATKLNQYAFSAATAIQSFYLPNVETLEQYALFNKGNSNLTSIELPKVTSVGSYALGGITKTVIFNLPNATDIGNNAFNGSTAMKSITLPKIKVVGNSAFNGCTGLKDVTFGSDAQTFGNTIFNGCTGLSSVTIYAATPCGFSGTTKNLVKGAATGGTLYVPDVDTYRANTNWALVESESSWTIAAIEE